MTQINPNNPHTIRSKRLLVYYFQLAFEKAGLRWDSDNKVEVEDIVDELLGAVVGLLQEFHESAHENYLEARRP